MKLIIQIPCYNEEKFLGKTLSTLPQSIAGVDFIEVLVIDDGSTDQTERVARENGATHVLKLLKHQGLARAFGSGIRKSLELGADVIVNLDADNQYPAHHITALIAPILEGRADVVVGTRNYWKNPEFSLVKKFLQWLGSVIVSIICGITIPDAASGFRAFTKRATQTIHIMTEFTYTLETLIQLSDRGFRIHCLPITVNSAVRPSRLMTGPIQYVVRSISTLLRLICIYKPIQTFGVASLLLLVSGLSMIACSADHRRLYFSGFAILILSAMAYGMGLLCYLFSVNRRLLETMREETNRNRQNLC